MIQQIADYSDALAVYRGGLFAALVLSLPLEAWERALARPRLDPSIRASLAAAVAAHKALSAVYPLGHLIPPPKPPQESTR
jgi:hypothetical protein